MCPILFLKAEVQEEQLINKNLTQLVLHKNYVGLKIQLYCQLLK
jgi:hypothetical protein